jgi:hypothetical protein
MRRLLVEGKEMAKEEERTGASSREKSKLSGKERNWVRELIGLTAG